MHRSGKLRAPSDHEPSPIMNFVESVSQSPS